MFSDDITHFAKERNLDKRLVKLEANIATKDGLLAQGKMAKSFR